MLERVGGKVNVTHCQYLLFEDFHGTFRISVHTVHDVWEGV